MVSYHKNIKINEPLGDKQSKELGIKDNLIPSPGIQKAFTNTN